MNASLRASPSERDESLPLTCTVDADAELQLKRTLVDAFLDNVPDFFYFKDRASRFIALSESLVRHLRGADQSEIIGKTDFDFFSDAYARAAFDDEQRIIRTGESMLGKLEKDISPNGRVTWVLSSKQPLRDEHGEIIGTFGISKDVTVAKETEAMLEKTRKELLDTSRTAGMAEVATGVLHNVGNVLNSLNVSATLLENGLRLMKVESLTKLSALIREHRENLGEFVTKDPKGQRVPELVAALARQALEERDRLLQELASLQKHTDHIREIVVMQQTYATMIGVIEPLNPASLMEDSLRMNAGALERHAVRVVREFQPAPPVLAEKGKVLQILVNLIRNAKYAADEGGAADKKITLRIEQRTPARVRFVVEDNGIGIPPEHLGRVFQHGFTTRATGHGFGLHSSISVAKELKGSLIAQSEGSGKGATFILELPVAPSMGPDGI